MTIHRCDQCGSDIPSGRALALWAYGRKGVSIQPVESCRVDRHDYQHFCNSACAAKWLAKFWGEEGSDAQRT